MSCILHAGKSGWWAVTPFQFAVCIGTTIANHIIGGQAMKVILPGSAVNPRSELYFKYENLKSLAYRPATLLLNHSFKAIQIMHSSVKIFDNLQWHNIVRQDIQSSCTCRK